MTTEMPRTVLAYPNQAQCSLFRLPRELRDEIYAYYAHDEEGYFYDYTSRRLYSSSGQDLNPSQSCKAVYEEMRGILFRVNTVTFTPGLAEMERNSHHGLQNRAAQFERLLNCAYCTKLAMLHCAAECISDTMIKEVTKRHPSIDTVFRTAIQSTRHEWNLYEWFKRVHQYRDVLSASFYEAIQDTLILISAHPDFHRLISTACTPASFYPEERPLFLEGSHIKVFEWQPKWWLIPSDEDLLPLESLLSEPETPNGFEFAQAYRGLKWYFSATAVSIRTLSHLHSETRMQLRSVVLRENLRGVGNPEAHTEGLIPFCIENPKLKILMQSGFSTNLLPSLWAQPSLRNTSEVQGAIFPSHNYFCIIVP